MSGRFLLREGWPIRVGLLQITFDILVPKFPGLLVVLQDQAIVQDLEILDLDRRKFIDGGRVTTESAELWFVCGRRFLEEVFVLGRCELVGGAFVSCGKFG